MVSFLCKELYIDHIIGFLGVSGPPGSSFLEITAQELPYTWLLKGNLR